MRLAQLAMGLVLLPIISSGCSTSPRNEPEYEYDPRFTGRTQPAMRVKVEGEAADEAMLASVRFYCHANRRDLTVTPSADSSLLIILPWPDIRAKSEIVLQNDTAIVSETSYNNTLTIGGSSCEMETTFRDLAIPWMLGGGLSWRVSMVTIDDASQTFDWLRGDTAAVVLRHMPGRRLELKRD